MAGLTVTYDEAVKMVRKAGEVRAFVKLTPEDGMYFRVSKAEALRVLDHSRSLFDCNEYCVTMEYEGGRYDSPAGSVAYIN